jgi:dTMP kinase
MQAADKRVGFFITLEGPEGGGKSTQIHRLAASLADRGFSVWTTREPGGTRVGEMIRPILLGRDQAPLTAWTEALLFTAARAQHVEEVIRPRLARGEIVLCDRYLDSTLAYQGYGRGLDLKSLRELQARATGGLAPDLTILFNLPVEAGLARIPQTRQDRLDRETAAFHQRVYAGYRRLAEAEPERWRQIDASVGESQVAREILDLTTAALDKAGVAPAQRRTA